jgi:hypothetical protein
MNPPRRAYYPRRADYPFLSFEIYYTICYHTLYEEILLIGVFCDENYEQ